MWNENIVKCKIILDRRVPFLASNERETFQKRVSFKWPHQIFKQILSFSFTFWARNKRETFHQRVNFKWLHWIFTQIWLLFYCRSTQSTSQRSGTGRHHSTDTEGLATSGSMNFVNLSFTDHIYVQFPNTLKITCRSVDSIASTLG